METAAIITATTKPAMTTPQVVTGRAAITVCISSSLIWFTPLIVGTAYQLARACLCRATGPSLLPSDLNRTPFWASLQLRLSACSACSTYHYLTIPHLIAIQNAPQHCQSVTHHHL